MKFLLPFAQIMLLAAWFSHERYDVAEAVFFAAIALCVAVRGAVALLVWELKRADGTANLED